MKFSPKLGVTLAALAALGLAASNAAYAQSASFSIDGTGNAQAGVYTPFTGTGILTGAFTPVVGGNGTSGGVTIATVGFGNGTYVDTPAATPGTAPPALLGSFLFSFNPGGAATVTLSGLSAGLQNVVVYTGQEGGTFAIPAAQGGSSQLLTGLPVATATFVSGQSYYEFTNVTPVAGAIAISITGGNAIAAAGGNKFAELSGVQVAPAVPEASSAIGFGVLLALGGLAVVARKRTVKA